MWWKLNVKSLSLWHSTSQTELCHSFQCNPCQRRSTLVILPNPDIDRQLRHFWSPGQMSGLCLVDSDPNSVAD